MITDWVWWTTRFVALGTQSEIMVTAERIVADEALQYEVHQLSPENLIRSEGA
jgi:hypothetical protein